MLPSASSPMPASLQNKVIVITGASSGIGLALAKRACVLGAMVVLAARSEDKLLSLAGELGKERALPVVMDVTHRQEHSMLLEKAVATFGHVDVWVNNAGRGINKSILDVTEEDFDEMMNVNAKSAMFGMQAAYPYFVQQKEGHIINLSSVLGRLPFPPQRSLYSASKHALNAITTSFRLEAEKEEGKEGGAKVKVSSVSPGMVGTEFGINVLGPPGADSRLLPAAQPVGEVVDVVVDLILKPQADVYTKPEHKKWVEEYFTADRMEDVERSRVPWTNVK
ncbi:hypothetical protein VYU27_009766 [Nannochloropsis oceanica]